MRTSATAQMNSGCTHGGALKALSMLAHGPRRTQQAWLIPMKRVAETTWPIWRRHSVSQPQRNSSRTISIAIPENRHLRWLLRCWCSRNRTAASPSKRLPVTPRGSIRSATDPGRFLTWWHDFCARMRLSSPSVRWPKLDHSNTAFTVVPYCWIARLINARQDQTSG